MIILDGMTQKLITVEDLNNTMSVDKDLPFMSCNCEKTCLLCGYHTQDKNASGQIVHKFCMESYSNYSKKLMENPGCSMCGSKTRKLVLDSNCCNTCLNSAFD